VKDLEERFLSGELVYDGGVLKVHRDRVTLPDGSEAWREHIRHPGAVAIIPLFDDGRVLLERQHRYPHRRDFIEIPAGKREPGEEALATAKRELLEETGYEAGEWTRLGVVQNAIAYSDEAIELFAARKLVLKERKLDEGEFIEILTVPFDEAVAMVRDGRITDAKSVSGLLWYFCFGSKS
jgi:ADP-ribose pyrophosphatase